MASGMVPSAIAGSIRCRTGVPGRVPLPRQQPVEHVEVRDAGGVHAHVLPARARQPAQLDGEAQPQQVGEEEDRDRDAEQRGDDRGGVHPAPVPPGGQVAQRDAEPDREHQRDDRELDGARHPLQELGGHRSPGARGVAEVQPDRTAQELQVLEPDRLVETEQFVVLLDGLRGGALAEGGLRGPAGQRAQPREEQHRQPEEDRDQLEEPPGDEAGHVLRSPFRSRTRPGRAGGRTATGAAGVAIYSFSETVEKTSAVSGLGSRPSTASLTTSAGGECEIGTPGR